jgi:hypothetical protein
MAFLAEASSLSMNTTITLLPGPVESDSSDLEDKSDGFLTPATTTVFGRCIRVSSSPLPSPKSYSSLDQ